MIKRERTARRILRIPWVQACLKDDPVELRGTRFTEINNGCSSSRFVLKEKKWLIVDLPAPTLGTRLRSLVSYG
jgi:hypothetical protein